MPYEARPADVDEVEEGPPLDVALENAFRKASAVARPGETVLGVDTIVALGSRIYGKPAGEADARATLRALAGREHVVASGLCVIDGERTRTSVTTTTVRFRPSDKALLAWYVASGEWRDRAGGYAIQGRGAALVAAIDGDYFNVVGLPVPALLDALPGLLPTSR